MQKDGDRIVETATEARGARLGRPVLAVLIGGVVLVVLIYAVIYFGFVDLG